MLPELFRFLPFKERWFVRGRLWTAPLQALAERVPAGRVLDVGCGHGALIALLLQTNEARTVVGVDPDLRKIQWAQQSVGKSSRVTLCHGTLETLADASEPFDAIVAADVLYLMPWPQREALVKTAWKMLRPGGTLLLKETEANGTWKHAKCLAQEALMVKILRRTQSSGDVSLLSRSKMLALMQEAGFPQVTVIPMDQGYTTPHVLFEAEKPQPE